MYRECETHASLATAAACKTGQMKRTFAYGAGTKRKRTEILASQRPTQSRALHSILIVPLGSLENAEHSSLKEPDVRSEIGHPGNKVTNFKTCQYFIMTIHFAHCFRAVL